jgi:hypothetical protein
MKRFRDTDYFVTINGEVWRNNKQRKPCYNQSRYQQLHLSINGKSKTMRIHRMVGECYIPNPNNLPEINHLDGNKSNNHVSNLIWSTQIDNIKHRDNVLNKRPKGEKNGNCKLTEEQVKWIRQNYIPRDKEFGRKFLCEKFNVSKTTIRRIINNLNWNEV